jgi:hypothetical protein
MTDDTCAGPAASKHAYDALSLAEAAEARPAPELASGFTFAESADAAVPHDRFVGFGIGLDDERALNVIFNAGDEPRYGAGWRGIRLADVQNVRTVVCCVSVLAPACCEGGNRGDASPSDQGEQAPPVSLLL